MLNLPASAAFNRRIPKQKFYEELPLTPALRRVFVGQINAIWWRSKIAPATANLAPGRTVAELEVFELQLAQPSLDAGVLRAIDKRIPYPIVYLLTCDGRCQAWIGYQSAGQAGARVYYHTAWQPQEDLKLELRGLDTDAAYENFVRQIAGGALNAPAAEIHRPRPAPPRTGKADRGVAEQDTQRKAAQPAGGAEWEIEEIEKGT